MPKIKLSEKQILKGIRFLNIKLGKEPDNAIGYYAFEDFFDSMGIEVDMPDKSNFHHESIDPENMSVGNLNEMYKRINNNDFM